MILHVESFLGVLGHICLLSMTMRLRNMNTRLLEWILLVEKWWRKWKLNFRKYATYPCMFAYMDHVYLRENSSLIRLGHECFNLGMHICPCSMGHMVMYATLDYILMLSIFLVIVGRIHITPCIEDTTPCKIREIGKERLRC